MALHRAGRFDQAEAAYRAMLDPDPGCPDALHLLGVIASQRGHFEPAIELILRALALAPDSVQYLVNLGEAYRRGGRPDDAAKCYAAALALAPELAAAHHGLGRLAAAAGAAEAAARRYRKAIAAEPGLAQPHLGLGELAFAAADYVQAAAHYRDALECRPGDAGLAFRLGVALRAAEAWPQAEAAFADALAIDPGLVEAHANLADLMARRGDLAAAERHYRQALEADSEQPLIHNNYAILLAGQGRTDAAVTHYRRALALAPDYLDAAVNLGQALSAAGRLDQATATLEAVLREAPDHAVAHLALGAVRNRQSRPEAAAACCRRAIALRPEDAAAWDALGTSLAAAGRVDEALPALRRAVALRPDDPAIHSNLAFCSLYDPAAPADRILATHRDWNRRHAAPLAAQARRPENDPDPDRRLKVGYVSADFRTHPVGFFLADVLAGHDRGRVEAICYSGQTLPDAMTARLAALADGWHDTAGMTDQALAAQIASDRIDLLVDMSGHTGGNRLGVFARRPAPVQLTWAAYAYSTGLDAIDGILADPWVVPEGMDRHYAEPVLRLPRVWTCYRPPEAAPDPGPPPALGRGHVTFGCFNNLAKVNARVIAVWAAILARLPDSRLKIKAQAMSDPAVAARFRACFDGHGIGAERIELAGATPLDQQLAAIAEVDIGLDTFPYTGSTTTLETLWMGVPVVTLAGRLYFERHALATLEAVGLGDLVAASPEQYLDRAVALARDRDRLTELRSGLRQRMAAAPVCDGPGFTRALEAAYRQAWHRWCGGAG